MFDSLILDPLKPKAKLFISYSHKDKKWIKELSSHLTILEKNNLIEKWYDGMIQAGSEWESDLATKLNEAEIIILLVSSNFLASNYCYDTEMVRALEKFESKEALVIPVIIRPFLWKISKFSDLEPLPKNGKPITSWDNQDEGWLSVAEGILKKVYSLEEKLKLPFKTHVRKSKPRSKGKVVSDSQVKNPILTSNEILDSLILDFLSNWNVWYFSPLRILKWGAKQNGFSELSKYKSKEIGDRLKFLLKKGKVKKIISQKGNPIYKIKNQK